MNSSLHILWFSNIRLSLGEMSSSGTWIAGMVRGINSYYPQFRISVITQSSAVKEIEHENIDGIEQWVLPVESRLYPRKSVVNTIFRIIKKLLPDIIHIWGTEFYWGVLPFKQYFPNVPVLLDMQGYLSSVYENYLADLKCGEILKCFSVKECLKPSTFIINQKNSYKQRIKREKCIFDNVDYISVQSKWIEACLSAEYVNKPIFHTGIALRPAFYESNKWSVKKPLKKIIFTTASKDVPYKGLYTILKAFRIISYKYPDAQLHIATSNVLGYRKSGYARFLESFIKKNRLSSKVVFLGSLDTLKLIKEYLTCDLFVNPSYVESYSLVNAEAMYLGVPTISAFAGAMGELGVDNESVLYYPRHDYRMCAFQIERLLKDSELSVQLSKEAICKGEIRNNFQNVVDNQVSIYNNILLNK